jgi:signal peptidase II
MVKNFHFVENNGMAFGFALQGVYGKLLLSTFRIIAVSFLLFFVHRLIVEKANILVLISFSLILSGALGNILDSAFYGIIFSESYYHGDVAEVFPENGGYSGFLRGKVVDMLHIPYFKPVFNIADVAITLGVIFIIFSYKQFLHLEENQDDEQKEVRGNFED